MSTNRISIFPTCMIELKLNSKILSMKSSYLKRFIYLKVYFTRVATKYEKQLLPGALLHLVGCDWLCPEALAGFATSSWPLKVAPVPPPASLRTSRQIQRGCGLARIGTTGFHKHKEKQKKKRKDGGKHSYEGHTVWITHLKATLQFLLACSALCLLEEGTPQLAHQHPSVELPGSHTHPSVWSHTGSHTRPSVWSRHRVLDGQGARPHLGRWQNLGNSG